MLAEALDEMSLDGAVAMSGGTQVALLLKSGLLDARRLVWLGRVKELSGVEARPEGLVIGAAVTLDEISRSEPVRALHPVIASTAAGIGNPRVRAVATLGGHLAHADPRQDLPPVLLALGARVRIARAGGSRELPVSAFFDGFMSTVLAEGEVLTAIVVPAPPPGRRAAYVRFAPGSASDYATVGIGAAVTMRGAEVVDAVIALGAGAAMPHVVESGARSLLGKPGKAEVEGMAAAVEAAADPSDDQRGSAAYKRAMVRLWTRRLLNQLLAAD